jgi:hypothetical protein
MRDGSEEILVEVSIMCGPQDACHGDTFPRDLTFLANCCFISGRELNFDKPLVTSSACSPSRLFCELQIAYSTGFQIEMACPAQPPDGSL